LNSLLVESGEAADEDHVPRRRGAEPLEHRVLEPEVEQLAANPRLAERVDEMRHRREHEIVAAKVRARGVWTRELAGDPPGVGPDLAQERRIGSSRILDVNDVGSECLNLRAQYWVDPAL